MQNPTLRYASESHHIRKPKSLKAPYAPEELTLGRVNGVFQQHSAVFELWSSLKWELLVTQGISVNIVQEGNTRMIIGLTVTVLIRYLLPPQLFKQWEELWWIIIYLSGNKRLHHVSSLIWPEMAPLVITNHFNKQTYK